MSAKKILYVTTELYPYQEDSSMAEMVNKMALKMYNEGNDVRVFMPRFGFISERKFQLHEVIRLSGMNIIINDLDQPLIIKVASLPGERMQIYFIDNDEYFKRKSLFTKEDGSIFVDNDERAIFFVRGVIETVKKLNWVPDIIHINGWMASLLPTYIKHFYKNDAYFNDTRFVLSLYNEPKIEFTEETQGKFAFDKMECFVNQEELCSHHFLNQATNCVDLVLKGDEFLEPDMEEIFSKTQVKKHDFIQSEDVGQFY